MMKQFGRTMLTVMGLLMSALVLLLTLPWCGPAAVAQSPTSSTSGNFNQGTVCSQQSATTVECITVDVVAVGSQGQIQTLLFYDDSIADASTFLPIQDTNGSGLIPNTAFQVHGNTDLLNIDTSKVPKFDNEFCTFDSVGTPTCNPASGGLVTATWNAISTLSTQITGTTKMVFTTVRLIESGTTISKPAVISFSVLGVPANGQGLMGQEQNTLVTVQRH